MEQGWESIGLAARSKVSAGLCVLGLSAALLLASCGDDRFPDYRYKMTVVVATPEGEKSFSSVRQIRQDEAMSIQDSSGRTVKSRLEGEAVILDLPDIGTAYALLSKPKHLDYGKHIAGAALLPMVRRPNRDPRFDDLKSRSGEYLDRRAAEQQAMVETVGPRDLPRVRTVNALGVPLDEPFPLWPMFVTFDDPGDSTTVREVSPESLGVQRITIEIVDEDVSTGIRTRLPWLSDYPEPRLDPAYRGSTDPDLSQSLTHGAFRQEISQ